MRAEMLIHQHPPTPPNAGAEYPVGLHQVAQYNSGRGYSFGDAGYGSPRSSHEGIPTHGSPANSHPNGLGIQYDGYGPPAEYYHNGQYNGMSQEQGLFSPPTPSSVNDDDSIRRTTRSGQAVPASSPPRRNGSSPRLKATPKAKKAKGAKSDKHQTPKLIAPLSILTRELAHIPVKNMEEWVNRSAETRRKEAEKRNGYITRPMNSFMLYRSAFAERAKSWCLQNNHQIVSSVAGESWPMEPPETRELYNEYAKIERINHQNAHPTYKFSPSKTAAPAKKRRADWSDEEEPSDLDDTEWARGSGRSRSRQARRVDRTLVYPSNGAGAEYFDRSFGPNGINRSPWEMTNDGRRMPMPMGQNDMYNQYYQTAAYPAMDMSPNMSPNYADDMRLRVGTPASSVQFQSNPSMLGLPGGNAAELMQLHSHAGTPFDEGQLDPMLLAYDGRNHSGINPAALQQNGPQTGHSEMLDDKLNQYRLDSLLELPHDDYHSGSWQSDLNMVFLEQESEFDKWMGEQ
ncbi:HMG box protein [Clathrospora elynae]|uniref:HMG box protein n=1 Tax=Clathrospora elynae TaxID=706981 RepID=A0A6A5SXN4_9PLEO|nr:HMG box protein [Clathrospora elynae]